MTLSRRDFLKMSGAAVLWLSHPGSAAARAVSVPVLAYRDLNHHRGDPESVSPSHCAAELEWLYEAGYHAVSLDELARTDAGPPARAVVITFDNGHVSFMEYAFPSLAQYGMKATVNVIGKYMGASMRGNDPRLSWDECRYLQASGLVEIGCQGWEPLQDNRSTSRSPKQIEQDLRRFQDVYIKEMGRAAKVLAWPNSRSDSRSAGIAAQSGFRILLDADNRYFVPGEDRAAVPRFTMRHDSLTSFRKLIEGRP